MRNLGSLLVSLLFAVAALSAPAFASNDKASGPPPHAQAAKFKAERSFDPPGHAGAARFSPWENEVVRGYFAAQTVGWTGLPPGIAKNFARGKPLPPGIAKKVLPGDLLAKLPVRVGYEYARVGRDIVLIELATNVVVDLIENIIG